MKHYPNLPWQKRNHPDDCQQRQGGVCLARHHFWTQCQQIFQNKVSRFILRNLSWLLFSFRRRSNIGMASPSSQASSASPLASCSSPPFLPPVLEPPPVPEPPAPESDSPPAPVHILTKPLDSMKLKVTKKQKKMKEKKSKHFVSPKRLKIMYRNLYGRVMSICKTLPSVK